MKTRYYLLLTSTLIGMFVAGYAVAEKRHAKPTGTPIPMSNVTVAPRPSPPSYESFISALEEVAAWKSIIEPVVMARSGDDDYRKGFMAAVNIYTDAATKTKQRLEASLLNPSPPAAPDPSGPAAPLSGR